MKIRAETEGGYITIPKVMLTDKRLPKPNIIEFYGVILSLSSQTGFCYASNSYFSNVLRCDKRSVARWIAQLKNYGYIKTRNIKSNSMDSTQQRRIYPLVKTVTQMSQGSDTNVMGVVTEMSWGVGQSCHGGSDTDVTHNNKDIILQTNIKGNNIPPISPKPKQRKLEDVLSEVEDEILRDALREFVKMRKQIKKPLTAHALELNLKKLYGLSTDIAERIQIVEQSVMNSWQGFFPLKNDSGTQRNQKGVDTNGADDEYAAIGW